MVFEPLSRGAIEHAAQRQERHAEFCKGAFDRDIDEFMSTGAPLSAPTLARYNELRHTLIEGFCYAVDPALVELNIFDPQRTLAEISLPVPPVTPLSSNEAQLDLRER